MVDNAFKTLSDGTEVSILYGFLSLDKDGLFEPFTIPVAMWPELKESIDHLLELVEKGRVIQ